MSLEFSSIDGKISDFSLVPSYPPPAKERGEALRRTFPQGRDGLPAEHDTVAMRQQNGHICARFLFAAYSLDPVSIKEPIMSFWKQPNRIRTGRTHTTEAAMTGALSEL